MRIIRALFCGMFFVGLIVGALAEDTMAQQQKPALEPIAQAPCLDLIVELRVDSPELRTYLKAHVPGVCFVNHVEGDEAACLRPLQELNVDSYKLRNYLVAKVPGICFRDAAPGEVACKKGHENSIFF